MDSCLFRLIALDWRSWVVRLKGLPGWEMDCSGLDETMELMSFFYAFSTGITILFS